MNNLQKRLMKASSDLGLKIKYNFFLTLDSGEVIEAELLLRNFGAEKGMLIFSNYKKISHCYRELLKKGYGFSTLSNTTDGYDRQSTIEMLSDWGWSGPKEEEPDWILPVDDEGNLIRG